MIQPINTKDGVRMAIALPPSWDRSTVRELKEGLLDMFCTCISTEDAKEATDSRSLFFVWKFTMELIKDFENDK